MDATSTDTATLPQPFLQASLTSLDQTFQILELALRTLHQKSRTEDLKDALSRAHAEGADRATILHTAGRDLGLQLRHRMNCLKDVLNEAGVGSPIIIHGANDQVALVLDQSPTAFKVFIPSKHHEHQEGQAMSRHDLQTALGLEDQDDIVLWSLIQVATPLQPSKDKNKPTPLARLMHLVAAERGDIRVVLVFAVAIGILNLATPITVEALVNTVAFGGLLQPVIVLAMVLMSCLGMAALLNALQTVVVELMQRRLLVRLTSELSYRLPHAKIEAFDKYNGPELVNRFFDVLTIQKVGAKFLLDVVTVLLSAIIGLMILAFYHPALLAFDMVLIVFLALVLFALGRRGVSTSIEESNSKYAIASWLEELARHHVVFKVADGMFAQDRADSLARNYLSSRAEHFRIVLRQLVSALALQVIASTALLILGGWLVEIGQLTLGQLVASWLIVSIIVSSIAKLGFQIEAWYDLLTSAEKIGKLLDLPIEKQDGCALPRLNMGLELETHDLKLGVRANFPALANVDLKVRAGERVALRGVSGSGKTTLLETLAGLRQPLAGHVEMDKYDLRELRRTSIQGQVAFATVNQVIEGSIFENIRLGRAGVTTKSALEALELVELRDELRSLPDGLDTVLSTAGQSLSAGQAHRLVLARAIADQPRLLLIDGLLDSLDPERRERILQRLCSEEFSWTLIVSSHSPEVPEICQRVIDLDELRRGAA